MSKIILKISLKDFLYFIICWDKQNSPNKKCKEIIKKMLKLLTNDTNNYKTILALKWDMLLGYNESIITKPLINERFIFWKQIKLLSKCPLERNPVDYNNYETSFIVVKIILELCCLWHKECYSVSKLEKNCPNNISNIFTNSIQNGKNYNFKCAEDENFNFLLLNITNIKNCRQLNNTKCQMKLCYCDMFLISCLSQFEKPNKPMPCLEIFIKTIDSSLANIFLSLQYYKEKFIKKFKNIQELVIESNINNKINFNEFLASSRILNKFATQLIKSIDEANKAVKKIENVYIAIDGSYLVKNAIDETNKIYEEFDKIFDFVILKYKPI
ncbi:hypothetical protein Mgra_00007601 [Meloidogyne graminicola]|uniref:Uncharacterized protein n=1 Tax=Meloidogyne graminicola TaxID=189291 RepID=A0A8S9ZIC8_9BILA|nr:hypothetical protein Mgra_00007601 [Meloidogyne graminicola]